VDKEYVRISKGLSDYSLIEKAELDISKIITQAGSKDIYYGIYTYTEKHYNKWKSEKTLRGVRDVTTDKIVFDFDDQHNTENARKDTLEVVDRLVGSGIELSNINIYFSGNRGYHIILNLQDKIDREFYESIVDFYAGGLNTLDKSVKDQQRLIRMPFTKNQKSGLYDIPITFEELNSNTVEEIRDKAKVFDEKRFDNWDVKNVGVPNKFFNAAKTKEEKEPTPEVNKNVAIDISKRPSWLSPARYALKEGCFEEGERNTACMILAATYKNNGIDSEECYQLLKRTLDKRKALHGADYDADELRHTVVEYVYSPHWKGGQYTEENDLIQKVNERLGVVSEDKQTELISFATGIREFEIASKGWRERLITTGIPQIDSKVMIEKGWMVGFLGAPGSGKTTFALNFAENLSREGKATLFMSLDMPYLMVIARMMQKEAAKRGLKYSIKAIRDTFDSGVDNPKLTEVRKHCEQKYQNIVFNNSSDTTLEQIEKSIEEAKDKYGASLNLIIIDYFEKIRGKFEGDPTTNQSHIASRLSGMAKRHDVCIMPLLQPRKAAGDPRSPLDNYTSIKGSSTIQQDCRVIMTMWRPGYNPQHDNRDDQYASIAVVKANMGEQCQMNFMWDGFSGTIKEMKFDEKMRFEKLTERLNRQREAENRYGKKN
jgi:replicative DNA helicase